MKYYCDDAIDYIENQGISCDPCSGDVGEYVCDLLDKYAEFNEEDECYYTEETLDQIVEQAKEYSKGLEDEEDE